MDAQQIYDNFHGSGAKGTSALEQAQQASYKLADSYQGDAVGMQKLINDIGSGWTGQASDAASQGLAPMTENLLATGQDLNTHQDLVYRQAQSFHRTASQVQQVPPAPSMIDIVGMASAGLITGNTGLGSQATSMYDQVSQHNAASQANVDAYNNYVQDSKFNSANLPPMSGTMVTSTTAPVAVGTSPQVAGKSATTAGPTAPRSTRVTAAGASRGGGAGVSSGESTSGHAPGNAAPVSKPPSTGGGVTRTSSVAPRPVVSVTGQSTGPVVAPVTGTGSGNGPGQSISAFPVGGGAGLPVDDGGSPGEATANIGARLAGGNNAPGEGAAAGGGNETLGGNGSGLGRAGSLPGLKGGGPGAGGGAIQGGRSGASPFDDEAPTGRGSSIGEPGSANAAEEAMASERAATAPGAVGPTGAGRGRRDEDEERQRKVPLSADADVFDDTDPVGVQVLGETYEQYRARIARDSGQPR